MIFYIDKSKVAGFLSTISRMADYFHEMGWRELENGEQPNHLLHMARFLMDCGIYEESLSGEWPRYFTLKC